MTIDWLVLTCVLNALWQVPLAAAVGLAGDWFLRRSPARLRHLLWLVVLAVAVILPLTAGFGPLLPRPIVRAAAAPVAAPPSAASQAAWRAAFPTPEQRLPAGAAAVGAGLWAVTVLAFGFPLGRAWLRARRLVRRARPLEIPSSLIPSVERCRATLGVRCEILGSPELPGPVTVGAWRPVILLPSPFFATASLEEAMAALGHEMAHVRRRDYAISLLCEALLLPIAFHPAARLLRRRLTETREMACDEEVVNGLVRRQTYARSLLALAAAGAGLPRPSTTLGALDAHTLEVRMKRILDSRPRTGSRPARAALGAALLLLGGIALAASEVTVRPVSAEARGGALGPFVGTWSADWTPDPKDGGSGQKLRALDLEIHPDGRILATWYKYTKEGVAPRKLVLPVTDYTVKGSTLEYKTHVEKFALPDKPPGPADFRESIELQGGNDAVWHSLSNSYVEALKKRGEPVPPPPPPIPMKRQP
ncbi:MAG TPA: M56 family metallopeptidase [Thermoanaerobaculia bacterium]|jgi:beta-lactamase regulating signal transducer with metallopeptidase domain